MKKIKLFFAATILCAATAVGYNVYSNTTMTQKECLMNTNIKELAIGDETTERY